MKKILYLLSISLFLLHTGYCFAQEDHMKMGARYFETGQFKKAISEYKKAKASWEKAKNLYKGKNDLEAVRKIDKLIKQLPQ